MTTKFNPGSQHTTDMEALKARIAALASKTVDNGCTEAEAVAAMEMVGKLLAKYNLTMSELDVRSSKMMEDWLQIKANNINNNVAMLASAIAMFVDCKCYTHRTYKMSPDSDPVRVVQYKIFGQEQDVKLGAYLLFVVTTAMLNDSRKFVKTLGVAQGGTPKPINSFQHGFALRIHRRLQEIKAASVQEQSANQGRSLIILKDALVTEEWQKRQEELGLKNRPEAKRSTDPYAYAAGQKAAEAVNLNRPLSERPKQERVDSVKLLG